MRIILCLFACVMMSSLASCKNPDGPDPPPAGDTPQISFSLDDGPILTYQGGPTDSEMDADEAPFTTIFDTTGTGMSNRLYLYASEEDAPYTISGSAYDYIILRINSPAEEYSGFYDANVLINVCSGGISYLNTSLNTLTLDSPVGPTTLGDEITGTFSGAVSDGSSSITIEGTFVLKHMDTIIPSGS